jgi:hypothetical protein
VRNHKRIKPGSVISRNNNPTLLLCQLLKASPIPFCEELEKRQTEEDRDPKTQTDF